MKGFRKGGTLVDIDQYVLAPPPAEPEHKPTAPPPHPTSASPSSTFYRQLTQQHPAASCQQPSTDQQPATVVDPRQQLKPARPAAAGNVISADNVGFRLLCKHGWETGTGLGASRQGLTEPLPAIANAGRRGLGGVPTDATKSTAAQRAASAQRVQAAMAVLPESQEGLETKRKRLQQVWQAEVDEEAERQLRRFMAREFADEGGGSTTDTNPLKRRSKLTASNPLL